MPEHSTTTRFFTVIAALLTMLTVTHCQWSLRRIEAMRRNATAGAGEIPPPSPDTLQLTGSTPDPVKFATPPIEVEPTPISRPPTPTPPPAPKPNIEEVFAFVQRYIKSDSSFAASAEFIEFPIDYFTHGQLSHSEWASECKEFTDLNSNREYKIIGEATYEPLGLDRWYFTIAIEFHLTRKYKNNTDKDNLAGISITSIGVKWNGERLYIISHKGLCARTTLKNGEGIPPDDWEDAKVARTSDGTTNLRSVDNDKVKSTILRQVPQNEAIKVIPELRKDWWIVQDKNGLIGFMFSKYIEYAP
jgi:hypothetical protein